MIFNPLTALCLSLLMTQPTPADVAATRPSPPAAKQDRLSALDEMGKEYGRIAATLREAGVPDRTDEAYLSWGLRLPRDRRRAFSRMMELDLRIRSGLMRHWVETRDPGVIPTVPYQRLAEQASRVIAGFATPKPDDAAFHLALLAKNIDALDTEYASTAEAVMDALVRSQRIERNSHPGMTDRHDPEANKPWKKWLMRWLELHKQDLVWDPKDRVFEMKGGVAFELP